MSFFRRKQSKEGQQHFEQRMEVARSCPSEVVDISECDLPDLPAGVYSLCKVLLKQALIMHTNRLRYLKEKGQHDCANLAKLRETLRVLDIHGNDLHDLPAEMGELRNLQVLNAAGNAIKHLPEELAHCRSLQTLNMKGNRLKELPSWVGRLRSLRQLDISDNDVDTLPTALADLGCLETLSLDARRMVFPPSEICCQGTASIMKALCAAAGKAYVAPSAVQLLPLLNDPVDAVDCGFTRKPSFADPHYESLARAAANYELLKDRKRKEAARLQEDILCARSEAAALIARNGGLKSRVLKQISIEQKEMDGRLRMIQQQHDCDHQVLLGAIEQMEEHATSLIGRILAVNADASRHEALVEAEEELRMREAEFFAIHWEEYESLRKADTAAAVSQLMAASFSLDELIALRDRDRETTLNRVIEQEQAETADISDVLDEKDAAAAKLLAQLLEDQDFQRTAVLRLMEDRDERFNRVNDQIALLQDELAKVSVLEITNRDSRADDTNLVLENQRMELTKLLMQLLDEKKMREVELQNRLVEMEAAREDSQVDYWLAQYQRLLNSKPLLQLQREAALDVDVAKVLASADADDYRPAFTRHRITADVLPNLAEEDLQRMGMYEVGTRKRVLEAIARLPEHKKVSSESGPPKVAKEGGGAKASAPPLRVPPLPSPLESGLALQLSQQPLIQARFEMECVVCLAQQSMLVFVPCGHVCCCDECGRNLGDCPLCRTPIAHRVHLTAQPNLAANLTIPP